MRRPLLAVMFVICLSAHVSADPVAEEIRAKVRTAVGYEVYRKLEHGIQVEGTMEGNDLKGTFLWRFHPDGRYLRVYTSKLPSAVGFDGKTRWEQTLTNPALPTDLRDGVSSRLYHALLAYGWLAPDGGYTVALDPAEHRPYRPCLLVRHPDMREAAARVYVDPMTQLPTRFSIGGVGIGGEVDLADYRDGAGVKMPGTVGNDRHVVPTVLTITTITPAPVPVGPDPFAAPSPAADIRFTPGARTGMETREAKGHLLVRPSINGKVGPWFALNPIYGFSRMSKGEADRLGLPAVGRFRQPSHGPVDFCFRPVERFELGPAEVTGLVILEEHPETIVALSRALGTEVAGLLGGDFLSRVALEADWTAGTVAIHDPKAYRPPDGIVWERVRFQRGVPHVTGVFEGRHTGQFLFAPNRTLGFSPRAVQNLGLLTGRETGVFQPSLGVGPVLHGNGNEFRVFGRAYQRVPTLFMNENDGSEAYPDALGSFGPSVLGPGTVVFDYPNRRMGFVPKP